MRDKVHIPSALAALTETWSQQVVAEPAAEFLIVGLNVTSNAAGGKPLPAEPA
jgi:hypothetical protein